MNLPEYQNPPYPVYKSYFVPYFDSQKGVHCDVRKVAKEDAEEWRHVLEKMRRFLESAVSGIEGPRKLESIGDLIVLFLKAPLLREPLEHQLPSPLKILTCLRILHLAERRLGLEELEREFNPITFSREAYKAWESMKSVAQTYFEILTEVRESVERCWFIFPADSRPVLNTSGLIPHCLVTSALAWIFAFSEGVPREKCAIVRLASLLHDFGKPFNFSDHVPASKEVAEFLLSDLIDRDSLNQIVELIEHHHDERHPLGKIIVEADRLASASDRLGGFLEEEFLKPRSNELIGRPLLQGETNRWEFWEDLHKRNEQLIYSLSEEFVRKIRKSTEQFTSLEGVKREIPLPSKPVEKVWVASIDTGGIQSFISRREELRSLGAASFTIDCLVMVQIPFLLQASFEEETNAWLPLETILYSAGGNVTLLLPSHSHKVVEKLKEELNVHLREVDPSLQLRLVSVPFRSLYFLLSEDLGRELGLSKIRAERREVPVRLVDKLCKTCQLLPPSDGGEECTACGELYELGTDFHFEKRWEGSFKVGDLEVVPSKCFGKDWKGAAGEVMAVVAGHDFEELEGGMEKRDYAVLSADGNLMGAFMGTSITLTDMYERSARIDLALKKAFEESALELCEALRKTGDNAVGKTLAVLKLGLLYMGGDDTLLLLPSWLAPLVSSSLAEKFLKHMGGARGISIGIAAGPYTSPVWSLIGAARELQKRAKKKVKEKVEEAREIQSAICFDVSDVVLSETSVRKRRESMENKEKSTVQPFLVDGESNKLRDLLELLLETRGIELCSAAYLASHSEETRKRLKEVRNIIREAVTASRNLFANPSKYAELVNSICKVYLVREMNRSEEGKKALYLRLLPLFAEKENSSYGDAELLIKMLGGGTI